MERRLDRTALKFKNEFFARDAFYKSICFAGAQFSNNRAFFFARLVINFRSGIRCVATNVQTWS